MPYKAIALIAFAYILGSIPFGLIISGTFYRVDIRKHGSGNIGATNVFRTVGPAAGALVLAMDLLKGLIPVLLAQWLLASDQGIVGWASVFAGLAAVLGHNYSVFLGFSGGKGMSTAGGMVLGLWPWVMVVLVTTWVLVIAVTRYVSLASILAAGLLPVLVAMLYPRQEYIAISAVAAIAVIYKHRSNISRLIAGEELKFGQKSE